MEGVDRRKCKKRTSAVFECNFECVGVSDWEEPDLPVWIGSAFRRSDEFQHLRDAPKTLPDLMQWLEGISERCGTLQLLLGPEYGRRRRFFASRLQLTPPA
ncbi:hypothetical protein M758_UG114900 [Ceratodon purpureus]|nr:hypothetical protein M758_UG114900 [Ceratodon purpureus]